MYLADYHTHSGYSYDGCEEIQEMCRSAVRAGLSEIAITDHVDIYRGLPFGQLKDFDVPQDEPPYEFGTLQDPMFAREEGDGPEGLKGSDDENGQNGKNGPEGPDESGHFRISVPGGEMRMPFGRLTQIRLRELYEEIAAAAQKYAGRLRVKAGAELGQPQVNPEEARKFLEEYPLDFVIGSVHNMDYDLDVYYYDFSQLDAGAVYDAYLDQLQALAQTGCFDVLGHLTYPLRYLYERTSRRLDLKPYMERLEDLFKKIEYEGRGIELNVSGLSKAFSETMPPMDVLKLYRQCHGEIITIGSDAHEREHIGENQEIGQEMLRAAGFRYITTYSGRKPSFVKI